MIELSSETSRGASNDSNSGRTMLYRPEIDNHGAEISPLCHFSAGSRRTGPRVPKPMFSGESGAVRRDRCHPSDLKHVVELLRCSDGLGVVITVGLHHLCMFYCGFQTPLSDFGRRLVVHI